MASRIVPGIGLHAYWKLGENSWKTGMDENLFRLSLLVQSSVIDVVEVLPETPADGDIYILNAPANTYHNHVAVYDVDLWVYITPFDGWSVFNKANQTNILFTQNEWKVSTLSAEVVKDLYESNTDTNAFTDAEKTKLANIEDNATADMTAAEIKTAYESNIDTNVFTDSEKAKLAGLSASRFLGVFVTLTQLQAAHPSPSEGSFAYVDLGPGTDILTYIWDSTDNKYVPQSGANSVETPETIKLKYEANLDTNAFTDAEKAKLESLDPNGGAGVPDGGTTGQVLTKLSDADGDADWADATGGGGGGSAEYPSFIENAGKVLAVNSGETDVEWVEQTGGGGGIPEAPSDGLIYGRQNEDWVEVEGPTVSANHQGARIKLDANETVTILNTWTQFRYYVTDYDTNGFVTVGNPNAFVIPEGVRKVRLTASVKLTTGVNNNHIIFRKNGVIVSGLGETQLDKSGYSNPGAVFNSGIIDVVPGDLLDLAGYWAANAYLAAESNWFAIEVIERTGLSVGINLALSELTDVDMASLADGDSVVWDAALGKFKAATPRVIVPENRYLNRPFQGAMVKWLSTKTYSSTPVLPVRWDIAEYDTDGFWSPGSPGRFQIPAGITMVKLYAFIDVAPATWTATNGNSTSIQIYKNGLSGYIGMPSGGGRTGYNDMGLYVSGPPLKVTEGDYFEVGFNTNVTGTITLAFAASYFAIEVLETEDVL